MANQLRLTAENPEELLNTGAYGAGAVIRLQTATTETGVYADVTGTGSTPTLALVAGTYNYPAFDPTSTSTAWYRTRFENVGATRVSDWSVAFQVGTGAYTSLFNVKQDLDRAPTDATSDELLLDYIAEATDYIRGYTSRDFATTSGTFTFDGYSAIYRGRCLLIPRGVQSISLLEVAANTGGSFNTISSPNYVLRPSAQERTPGWPATEVWMTDIPVGSALAFFPRGIDNIRITGVLGFGVPARIEGVARRLVVRAYAARQAGGNDMTGSENGTPIVSQFLSKRDREVLDGFAQALVA
jgi:hypothetical protein